MPLGKSCNLGFVGRTSLSDYTIEGCRPIRRPADLSRNESWASVLIVFDLDGDG